MSPRGRCPACTSDPRREHTDAELKEWHSKAILIEDADGIDIPVDAGEFYINPKARPRRMMQNSLSSDARQVYACLELATMGFQQELAVKMVANKRVPLTPADVASQTGLSKQHVRRGMAELEAAGLGERRGDTKGKVLLYSWAVPREVKEQNGSHARLPFPDWFPENSPLAPLVRRLRLELLPDLVATRGYHLERMEEVARSYQEAEMVAIDFLKGVSAPAKTGTHKRKNERTSERTGDTPSSSSSSVPPEPTTTTDPRRVGCFLCGELAVLGRSLCPAHLAMAEEELSAIACVAEALRSDEEAAKTLISRCREHVPDVTPTEIADHVGMKRAEVAGKPLRGTLVGLLLVGVPKMITRNAIALYRARKRTEAEEEAQRARRQEEERIDLCRRLGIDPETDEPLEHEEPKP